jgi:hypothetical protein
MAVGQQPPRPPVVKKAPSWRDQLDAELMDGTAMAA